MLEITRGKSLYQFRINPYQPCEIDYRKNKAHAVWYRHSTHATPEEAIAELFKLEKKEEPKP